MAKNEIQESRMKNYFITAAKEMIRGEGIKTLSVRTIAARAGYSYATLYNHFKDLSELMHHCISDFADECVQFVDSLNLEGKSAKERIEARTKAFINYFVQYPSTFELIFTERINFKASVVKGNEIISQLLDKCFGADWDALGKESKNASETETKKEMHKHFLLSSLSLYLLRSTPGTYKELNEQSAKMLKKLL